MKSFRAGIKIDQGYYKSFQPNSINKDWLIDDPEIQAVTNTAAITALKNI